MKIKRASQRIARAFTLIELLVVIAIVAILAAMILPVLAKAKAKAMTAACLNGQSQMVKGWIMYSSDNQDTMMRMGQGMTLVVAPFDWQSDGWCGAQGGVTLDPAKFHANSVQDAGIQFDQYAYRVGQLYPYAPNTDIIHCPADTRFKMTPPNFAYRSYSGNDGIDGAGHSSGAIPPGWPGGTWSMSKVTDIKHPSDKYVFLEENDPRGITVTVSAKSWTIGENLGTWSATPNLPELLGNPNAPNWDLSKLSWYDGCAAFHGASSTFSFADSHVESHRWLSPNTIWFNSYTPPAGGKATEGQAITGVSTGGAATAAGAPSTAGAPQDLQWVWDHFATMHYP